MRLDRAGVAEGDNQQMLERGSHVPHFVARAVDGSTFSYRDIWQRRNLILISAPATPDFAAALEAYGPALASRADDLALYEATVVLTHEAVDGLSSPGVLLADRWGEIYFVYEPANVAAMPTVTDLVDSLKVISFKC